MPTTHNAVVVSETSVKSQDPDPIVASNVDFVNALLEEYLHPSEIDVDALRSYYVDYYLAQMNNGGFSQFVYNSRWSEALLTLVRDGLRSMGAMRHLAIFEEGAALVERFGPERLKVYFASEYFGENPDRDELNAPNERFSKVAAKEDLVALNAAWLRGLPNLRVMSANDMKKESRKRGQAIPDREQRIAKALANEPRYLKLVRLLCKKAGQELDHMTAGDPSNVYQGIPTFAWHFLTDKGHHHMVEVEGKAIMLEGFTTKHVCEVDAKAVS